MHFKLNVLQYEQNKKLYHQNVILEHALAHCPHIRSLAIQSQAYNQVPTSRPSADEKVHDQLYQTPLFFNHLIKQKGTSLGVQLDGAKVPLSYLSIEDPESLVTCL